MAAIISSKLDSMTDRVRLRPVSWDGYARAGLLSQGDVGTIQKATNADLDGDDVAQEHASLYNRLLEKLNRNEARAYVLVLVGDLIKDEKRVKLISPAAQSLLNLLTSTNDEFIRLKSAAILCNLPDLPDSVLNPLLSTLAKLVGPAPPISSAASTSSSSSSGDQDIDTQLVAVQCICTLFRSSAARLEAWKREEKTGGSSNDSEGNGKQNADAEEKLKVIFGLVALLRQTVDLTSSSGSASGRSTPAVSGRSTPVSTSNTAQSSTAQLAYYLGFAFWLLSFEHSFAEEVNAKYRILIPLLNELGRNALKEKVARVVLATLRNFATFSPSNNLPAMIAARVEVHLQQLASSKRWGDEEIKEDVEYLQNELKEAKKRMTTYDEYSSELESGRLRWTPPHENVDFWRENAGKLHEKDNAQLKALLNLLLTSKDTTVLAVACNDIGQYIQYCDGARKHIDTLGGKSRIMALLQHPDPDVKYYSLQTVQKLISQPWSV